MDSEIADRLGMCALSDFHTPTKKVKPTATKGKNCKRACLKASMQQGCISPRPDQGKQILAHAGQKQSTATTIFRDRLFVFIGAFAQQLPEFFHNAVGIIVLDSFDNTGIEMLLKHHLGGAIKRRLHGLHLVEDVNAIALIINHFVNMVEMSDGLGQAG